jgi:hypothetical protein
MRNGDGIGRRFAQRRQKQLTGSMNLLNIA